MVWNNGDFRHSDCDSYLQRHKYFSSGIHISDSARRVCSPHASSTRRPITQWDHADGGVNEPAFRGRRLLRPICIQLALSLQLRHDFWGAKLRAVLRHFIYGQLNVHLRTEPRLTNPSDAFYTHQYGACGIPSVAQIVVQFRLMSMVPLRATTRKWRLL